MYFGPFTHQSAGLNRTGRFLQTAREKGNDRRGNGELRRRGAWRNEKWRRITGIYPHVETSVKARRAGLARLAGWVESRVMRRLGDGETGRNRSTGVSPVPRNLSFTDEWDFSAERWARCQNRGVSIEEICVELGISSGRLSALTKEYCGVSASEFIDGLMIRNLKPILFEKICAAAFELWGSPGSLVWEKLGTVSLRKFASRNNAAEAKEMVAGAPSAGGGELESRLELVAADEACDVDNASVQSMSKVAGRGRPTHQFSELRSQNGQNNEGRFARSPSRIDSRFGKSRYFSARPKDLFDESRAEERARRLNELCESLRARRDRTGGQASSGTPNKFRNSDCGFRIGEAGIDADCLFDLEAFALHAGFSSAARLKRACLNVFGKRLRQLEEVLAEEVLQFYLCAEDKELREIASRENEIAVVFCAREIYHGSEDPPKSPFLDEWSKFEELRPHWLSRMREMFGS